MALPPLFKEQGQAPLPDLFFPLTVKFNYDLGLPLGRNSPTTAPELFKRTDLFFFQPSNSTTDLFSSDHTVGFVLNSYKCGGVVSTTAQRYFIAA